MLAGSDPIAKYWAMFRAYSQNEGLEDHYCAALEALDKHEAATCQEILRKFVAMYSEGGFPNADRQEALIEQAKRVLERGQYISTETTDAKERFIRLEHLCGHLEHMLSEVFTLTEEASSLCDGAAKDTIQRASASIVIAMEFREMIIDQVEALSGYDRPKLEAVA